MPHQGAKEGQNFDNLRKIPRFKNLWVQTARAVKKCVAPQVWQNLCQIFSDLHGHVLESSIKFSVKMLLKVYCIQPVKSSPNWL